MNDLNLKIRHAKRQNAQNLDLSNMSLEHLPPEFYALKTLINVNLSNNKLSEIDKEIVQMKHLNELNLENNNISTLPIDITNLSNLVKLKLENNPIYKNLKDYSFNWKSSLKEYLNSGKINDVNTSDQYDKPTTSLNSMNKKIPFNLNMKKFNNTFTNFNNNDSNIITYEIPKCKLFDQRKIKNSAFNINKINDITNIATTDNTTPIKISSSSITKYPDPTSNITSIEDRENLKIEKSDQVVEKKSINQDTELKLNDEEVNSLKINYQNSLDELNAKIKILENEIKLLKLKSETTIDRVIKPENSNNSNTKRNWMDNSTLLLRTDDNDNRSKELETQLQKEIQTNKRLKNEVDRLQALQLNKPIVSSDDMTKFFKDIHEIKYEEINLSTQIGQGGFSVIYKGNWKFLTVAVKIIFDPNVTDDLLNEFNNEIKMLFLLRHPNIIFLLGICCKPQKLAIITEFIENGSLFDLLHKSNKEISYGIKIKIIVQLAKTYAYIHENGIIHRDIKSHNVLIDENMNVKLCDFGLAKYKSELTFSHFSGTPSYMAPELFLKKAYNEKIDVFAFGTMMWEILVRKIPYEGYDIYEIKNKVINEELLFIPKTVNNELGSIINSCRLLDASKRPSFVELVKTFSEKLIEM